jgi:hypothetical protein
MLNPSKTVRRKSFAALATVSCILVLAVLACTANDTLFIKLTETPVPTVTPTPIDIETKVNIGDTVTVIGPSAFQQVGLAGVPGPYVVAQSPGLCLPGLSATIQDVAQANDIVYFKLACSGSRAGWLQANQVTAYARNTPIVIKAQDGQGSAVIYTQNDANAKTADEGCPDGTEATVLDVVTGRNPTDMNVYVQISCNSTRGYVLEQDIMPAS